MHSARTERNSLAHECDISLRDESPVAFEPCDRVKVPTILAGYRGPYPVRESLPAFVREDLVAMRAPRGRPVESGKNGERTKALALLANGVAQRDVAAIVGVAHGTVVRWVRAAKEAA